MPLSVVGGAPQDATVVAMSDGGELLLSTVVSLATAPSITTSPSLRRRVERRFGHEASMEYVSDPQFDPRVREAMRKHAALGDDGDRRL